MIGWWGKEVNRCGKRCEPRLDLSVHGRAIRQKRLGKESRRSRLGVSVSHVGGHRAVGHAAGSQQETQDGNWRAANIEQKLSNCY